MLFRVPGPLDLFGATPNPDGGTLAVTNSSPPGPTGTNVDRTRLNDSDQEFIDKVAGRRMDGHPLPLPALLRLRERTLEQYKEAVGQFGPQSQSAAFAKATLARIAELIAIADSPQGKAADKLRQLLDKNDAGAAPSIEDFSDAVSGVLAAEHDAQAKNPDGTGSQDAMELVGRAVDAAAANQKKEIRNLLRAARMPGNKVTDEDMQKAIGVWLGTERSRALLGRGGENGDPEVGALMEEITNVAMDRKVDELNTIIEQAKKPGSNVTDDQLAKALGGYLGAERQRQLLGGGESLASDRGQKLMMDAMEFSHNRHKATLRSLVERAKQPGNSVTKEEMQEAVSKLLGGERQRQLLGASDGDSDKEFGELFEQATEVFAGMSSDSKSGLPSPAPKKSDNVMRMDDIHIIGHVPVR